MKNIFLLFFTVGVLISKGQENDKINYHCNDKWLDELMKTDSISTENRKMDYMCLVSIFDSIEVNNKYKTSKYLRAIAIIKNECDGAFSEAFFYRAFEYVFKNPNQFLRNLKYADTFVLKNWSYMLWNEYGIRSSEDGNYGKNLIKELELLIKDKNQLEWMVIRTELLKLD